MSLFSQNTKRNDLTKKKNCGQEQHSPDFPKKKERWCRKVLHEARLAPIHVFKQLRFTSKKADSAVTNRKKKKKKENCTFFANSALRLRKSHRVIHSLTVYAAETRNRKLHL